MAGYCQTSAKVQSSDSTGSSSSLHQILVVNPDEILAGWRRSQRKQRRVIHAPAALKMNFIVTPLFHAPTASGRLVNRHCICKRGQTNVRHSDDCIYLLHCISRCYLPASAWFDTYRADCGSISAAVCGYHPQASFLMSC